MVIYSFVGEDIIFFIGTLVYNGIIYIGYFVYVVGGLFDIMVNFYYSKVVVFDVDWEVLIDVIVSEELGVGYVYFMVVAIGDTFYFVWFRKEEGLGIGFS